MDKIEEQIIKRDIEEEMKTAEFIVSLNINPDTGAAYETSVWIQDNEEIPINRGYPIFIWQSE